MESGKLNVTTVVGVCVSSGVPGSDRGFGVAKPRCGYPRGLRFFCIPDNCQICSLEHSIYVHTHTSGKSS